MSLSRVFFPFSNFMKTPQSINNYRNNLWNSVGAGYSRHAKAARRKNVAALKLPFFLHDFRQVLGSIFMAFAGISSLVGDSGVPAAFHAFST
jgi:hypothetical protein